MPKKIRITERQKRLLESYSQYGDTYGFDNPTDSESIFKADLENELLTYAEEKGIEGNVAGIVDYIMSKKYREPKTHDAYTTLYSDLVHYGKYRLDTINAPQRYTDGMDLDEVKDYFDDTYDVGGVSARVVGDLLNFEAQEMSIKLGNTQLSEEELEKYGEEFKGYIVKTLKLIGGQIQKDKLRNVKTETRTQGVNENEKNKRKTK
jgi:hypothetical protein